MHSGMVHVTNTVDGVNFWGECVTTLGVPDLRCIDPPGEPLGPQWLEVSTEVRDWVATSQTKKIIILYKTSRGSIETQRFTTTKGPDLHRISRKNTMASLSFPTVCLLVLAGCAAYVTANGYGQSAYSYARPQIYAPARPSFGYAGTGVGGGLSGGLGLNSDLGGILPILLIFLVLGLAAPALIGSLQSVRDGTNDVLRSRSL
ncbi:uncharacterized protein [Magallana gigas]|uniref:uncharacterized protein isoform X1 n=2 Tax=Magallana gigas TaxID=29159 RepID=UPI00333ED888